MISEEIFNYFNTDINLFILKILLEGFYRGQNTFTLDQFLKENYWKIDEISAEICDTNDFDSVEDMVLNRVFEIIQVLDLGKIRRFSINNISGLLELVVRKIVKTKNPTEDDIMYYTNVINEIYDLKKLREAKIKKAIKEQKKDDVREMLSKLNFDTYNEALKYLNYSCSIAIPYIELEISFIDEVVKKTDKMLDHYLWSFSQNDFIDQKSIYKQKRYYFSKQLENFYNYIKEFPVIDDSINISFFSLEEQGFEVVKILSYLETEKRIKVRNWNDVDMWNVKFHITPITLQSLVSGSTNAKSGLDNKLSISKQDNKDKLKFYPITGHIEYKDEIGITKSGNKDYALLSLLHNNKNTAFNTKDIKIHCNHLVNKSAHKFKKEKDIDDTIRQIRFKLKVNKGAFFPIIKRGEKEKKLWLWIEK